MTRYAAAPPFAASSRWPARRSFDHGRRARRRYGAPPWNDDHHGGRPGAAGGAGAGAAAGVDPAEQRDLRWADRGRPGPGTAIPGQRLRRDDGPFRGLPPPGAGRQGRRRPRQRQMSPAAPRRERIPAVSRRPYTDPSMIPELGIEMIKLSPGLVTLSDRRTQSVWSVDLAAYQLGSFPITQAQYAE